MRLYHYTCAHAAPKIAKAGVLFPFPHRMLPQVPAMVWLTDLDQPVRAALGLPPIQRGCNRVQFRVTVDVEPGPNGPFRWPWWARRGNVFQKQYSAVEVNCPGSLVAHWWLALGQVPIESVEQIQAEVVHGGRQRT